MRLMRPIREGAAAMPDDVSDGLARPRRDDHRAGQRAAVAPALATNTIGDTEPAPARLTIVARIADKEVVYAGGIS